ncbi:MULTISPECIES: hypothetical protein [Paenibacillus]|nr:MULTISPECIES: hypothetical protein [Paenibacillus]
MIAHHNQTLHGFDNIDRFVLVRNSAETKFWNEADEGNRFFD